MVYDVYPQESEVACGFGPELYHHGIDGMKWGIRRFQNPDGTLTAEGRERYRKSAQETLDAHTRKIMKKSAREEKREAKREQKETKKLAKTIRNYENPYFQDLNKLSKIPQIKNAVSKMKKSWDEIGGMQKKLTETEDAFEKRKDIEKWTRKAAQEAYEKYGKESGVSFDDMLWGYLHDDFDQGQRTTKSFDIWLEQSGEKAAKAYLRDEKKIREARENFRAGCKEAVSEFLGEYGNKPAPGFSIKYENGKPIMRQSTVTDHGANLVADILSKMDADKMGELGQLKYMERLEA